MRFFIYSRKSIYTGKGESIENQVEMCRRYISGKFPDNKNIDISIYEDEGFSAKNTNRPQFQQMLRDLRRLRPDWLVCYRLDRISRSVSDFSTLIEELNRLNIAFICIREEFDTSKPMGKAMMYIASVFAQLERETIAERVRDNMMLLARTGRWLGGTPPTGYTAEKLQEIVLDGKIKTTHCLRECPRELTVIDQIFQVFLEQRSISAVGRHLDAHGIRSRSGGCYSLPGIRQILQNPVYCAADEDAYRYFTENGADVCFDRDACSSDFGLLAYNKRDYRKKHAPRQSVEKWIVAIGKHRGKIPGKKWVQVQQILAGRPDAVFATDRTHNRYALLSGLLFCGSCGAKMLPKSRGGTNTAFDYICLSKLRGGAAACACQNLSGTQTDAVVYAQGTAYILPALPPRPQLEALHRRLQAAVTPTVSEHAAEAARLRSEMQNLLQILADGGTSPALVRQIGERISVLERQLSVCTPEVPAADMRPPSSAIWQELCTPTKFLSTFTQAEKRALLHLLFRRIVWNGLTLQIFLTEK